MTCLPSTRSCARPPPVSEKVYRPVTGGSSVPVNLADQWPAFSPTAGGLPHDSNRNMSLAATRETTGEPDHVVLAYSFSVKPWPRPEEGVRYRTGTSGAPRNGTLP